VCNILVLVSGGGTNLQALLDAEKSGDLGAGKIAMVISDRRDAYALERAKAADVGAIVMEPDKKMSREERRQALSDDIYHFAKIHGIDLIVYAGFLWILKGKIIEAYANRMINIHPALLPKFGGKGMYGEHVHRAVLDAGETESGCTVHLVDAGTDTGPILLQRKVPVLPGDTPESLAARILKEEHIAIVEAVKMMVDRHTEES
jgi:phosphoribosylglycinamide formyltransferase-1